MSGYCNDCGNNPCLCHLVIADEAGRRSSKDFDKTMALAESRTGKPPLAVASGVGQIKHEGYTIEVVDGCLWLTQDLKTTHEWEKRGVWGTIDDAELALARSLAPNDGYQPRGDKTHE